MALDISFFLNRNEIPFNNCNHAGDPVLPRVYGMLSNLPPVGIITPGVAYRGGGEIP